MSPTTALLLLTPFLLPAAHALAGELSITTDPPGAAVFLDGAYVGASPVKVADVEPGAHAVRVERRGHLAQSKRVEVADEGGTVKLKLRRVGNASLTVTTDPPDACVYLNGEFRGTTPLRLRDLPPDDYHLRLEKVNFTPVAEQVDLSDGDDETLERDLESRSVDFYLTQIEADPDRVVNHTELCHLYMLQRRFDEGFQALTGGLRAAGSPTADREEIRRLYAEVEKIWEGQYEFASEDELGTIRPRLKGALEQAVLTDPGNPHNYEALGSIFREEKNLDGAIDLFQKAYERVEEPMVRKQLEREISRVLLQRARSYEKAKEYDKAIAQYRDILQRFPRSSNARQALYYIASAYSYRLRDADKAIETKLEYIRRFPDADRCPAELSQIATLYRRKKEYDKVIETYRQIIRDYPDYDGCVDAQWAIASTRASYLKDREGGIEEYHKFIKLFPESDRCADAYNQLGSLYRQSGKDEESKQAYATLAKQYPLSRYAYYQRRGQMDRDHLRKLGQDWAQAAKLVKAKKYEEAIAAYRQVQKDYTDTYYNLEAQQQIIRLYERYVRDADKARDEQRRFMELFPDNDSNPSLQYQIAYALYRAKDWENAIPEYETFVRMFPTDDRCPQFLGTIANIYQYYLKQPDKAIATYRRLIRDYPTYDGAPKAWTAIGNNYATLDRLKEAKDAYNHVINSFPDSEEAYDAWRALRRLP